MTGVRAGYADVGAVRGELDDEGAFVKWDKSTREKKRQELAAKPGPAPDFPFPVHVASDRLHWLRQELEAAIDADKPRLAKLSCAPFTADISPSPLGQGC